MDSVKFVVPTRTAVMSPIIETIVNSWKIITNGPRDAAEREIYLSEIRGPVMRIVLDWCARHANVVTADETSSVPDPGTGLFDVSDWDSAFLKAHEDYLVDLKTAAAVLQLDGLEKAVLKVFFNIHWEWSNK
ncbi:uncharacterized protein LOC106640904 [Copidosoma floridanum]|uniref:uncharacterized protein LOC106640904 n=1 Tax=Copidosoma floridanum TaxID=29053 RepID=UPI0006C9AF71|nr:uncharacterized protein LOC106640904 [Copidosoma floridanum]